MARNDPSSEPVTIWDLVLRKLGRRFAFLLAFGATGGPLAELTGSMPLGLAVGAVAGLVVLWRLPAVEEGGEPVIASEPRAAGGPFEWTLTAGAGTSIAEAVDRLGAIGMRTEAESESFARLSSGSELHTRILGGYFVDPRRLPVDVTLTAHGDRVTGVARDAIGSPARRDRALETRYALRVREIGDALEGR